MFSNLTDLDRHERDSIIAEIHAAFKDVTRSRYPDSTSWNESVAIDNYEPHDVCFAARCSDTDKRWTELINNPNWSPFPGIGGFCFINSDGFRYYLPPTMVRMLSGDNSEWYPGHLLSFINNFTHGPSAPLWTDPQQRAIARFISFMARHDDEVRVIPDDPNPWADALEAEWGQWL